MLIILSLILDYCSLDKCVDGLGLNDFLGQVIPVWLRELHVVSSLLTWGWWLELVLNSISGNDVAVESVQHH